MPRCCFTLALSLGVLTLAFAAPVLGQRDEGGIAAIGNAITYQGMLQQGGAPLNGTCDLQFSLWNALSAGAQIGTTQTFLAQSVTGGQITVSPDFGVSAFDGNDRWIQIAVRAPAGGGAYTTLTPRQKLSAVPYALFSVGGNTGFTLPYAASASSASTDLLNITNTVGGGNSGRLGGVDAGAIGKHNATGNIGFVGHAEYGVFAFAADATSIGVRGHHTPTGNSGYLGTADYGVYGYSNNPLRWAVYGFNESQNTSGRMGHYDSGVLGVAASSNGSVGVRGTHAPFANYGELGRSDAGVYGHGAVLFSYGVYGDNQSTGNAGYLGSPQAGVYGVGTATVANSIGVLGTASGTGSVAVQGVRGSTTGSLGTDAGVRGSYNSGGTTNTGLLGAGFTGVYGHSATGTGIIAETNTSSSYALKAQNMSGSGTAAYFIGDLVIDNGACFGCNGDLAEAFAVEGEKAEYEPGDVLSISIDVDDTVVRCAEPYSTLVMGVYATAPAMVMRGSGADTKIGEWVPVGIVGVIPTKVSVDNGSIQRGDLLVTSSTPGHAMKGTERERMLGAILGKALENFDGDAEHTTGIIKVMVNVK